MDSETFVKEVKKKIPAMTILDQIKPGCATVLSYEGNVVRYRRGDSEYDVDLKELGQTYEYYKGKEVSTSDLKKYKPSVFGTGQSAHGCNRTFFFLILMELDLVKNFSGEGKPGNPYKVQL